MHRWIRSITLALGVLAVTYTAAQAQNASAIWAKAHQRINSMRDYTLSYNYDGPKGAMVFDYACVRPDAIRTKVVKGENAGAILVYKPAEYGQCVKARKGWLGKSLALTDPKVKGTPVIKPVYDLLLQEVKGATSVTLAKNDSVLGHAVYVLSINAPSGHHEVSVDKATYDVLRWRGPDGERVFYGIKVNCNPRIGF